MEDTKEYNNFTQYVSTGSTALDTLPLSIYYELLATCIKISRENFHALATFYWNSVKTTEVFSRISLIVDFIGILIFLKLEQFFYYIARNISSNYKNILFGESALWVVLLY